MKPYLIYIYIYISGLWCNNHLETYWVRHIPVSSTSWLLQFHCLNPCQSIPHNNKLYIKYPNENPWIYASRSYGGYELTTSTNNVPVPMKNRPSSSASHVKWLYLGAEMPYCQSSLIVHKQPAGPETVPIKRTFFKQMVILPQCRADLMIGNPGKTWGAFFGFSASSLQRMHRYQLAVSILVNASPLPSSSIHHQEVTFGTQVAGTWLFHQIPHRTCNVVNDPRDLSNVAACNVVNDPRDLSSVATYNVVNDPRDLSSVATYNVVNDPRDLSSVATCNVVNDPRDLSSVATCNVVNNPRDLSSVATCNVVNNPRDLSSVATCNVVNNPRDLSSMAIYHVRSARNVNMTPHPTPPHQHM